jgi:hypothetical protein
MKISSEVHHYMETLFGQVLSKDKYVNKFDREQNADIAVKNTAAMIQKDRRKNRNDEAPVIFSCTRYDGYRELDWYETPIHNVNLR